MVPVCLWSRELGTWERGGFSEVLLETKLQGQDSKSPGSPQTDNDELPCPIPQPMSTSVDAEARCLGQECECRLVEESGCCSSSGGRNRQSHCLTHLISDSPHSVFPCGEMKDLPW